MGLKSRPDLSVSSVSGIRVRSHSWRWLGLGTGQSSGEDYPAAALKRWVLMGMWDWWPWLLNDCWQDATLSSFLEVFFIGKHATWQLLLSEHMDETELMLARQTFPSCNLTLEVTFPCFRHFLSLAVCVKECQSQQRYTLPPPLF